jgi:hypothetical protein
MMFASWEARFTGISEGLLAARKKLRENCFGNSSMYYHALRRRSQFVGKVYAFEHLLDALHGSAAEHSDAATQTHPASALLSKDLRRCSPLSPSFCVGQPLVAAVPASCGYLRRE